MAAWPAQVRAEALRLRRTGVTLSDVSERLGVPRSTISAWALDPDGSRARGRKLKAYAKPCRVCGKLTNPQGKKAGSSGLCAEHWKEHHHATRWWTPERTAEGLQAWARELGHAPTAREALVNGAKVPCSIVQREFGSWSKGLRAAGLEPRRPGQRREPRLRDDDLLDRIREAAKRLGRTPTAVECGAAPHTLVTHFGGHNAAVARAGLVPRKPGQVLRSEERTAESKRAAERVRRYKRRQRTKNG